MPVLAIGCQLLLDLDQGLLRFSQVVMYQANIDNGAELQYALFDQPWLLFAANQQDNPNQLGNSINCLFSRLRCQYRAQRPTTATLGPAFLMYCTYIAVFRAVLPGYPQKIQINKDAQKFNQLAIS